MARPPRRGRDFLDQLIADVIAYLRRNPKTWQALKRVLERKQATPEPPPDPRTIYTYDASDRLVSVRDGDTTRDTDPPEGWTIIDLPGQGPTLA
jgi:hypothetical protein